jgi:ATP-dependent helicase HrpA
MTDGILLAELQHDRMLTAYDTVIIDEAHERSLNIDFLLGYLKRLLPKRPDLKVVITSATIDPARFAAHFADHRGRPAPVIEVSGRTYPVEVRYRPLVEERYDDEDGEPVVRDQTEAVVAACQELVREGPGDILVFLPGEREIRDTTDVLAGASWGRETPELVPLFARLSSAEQHRVFAAHTGRRIVLATNVAETSLTVPGIRYVVDTGVARISRYSARSKIQRLPVEPVSQASARQRSGRCGRTAPGVAIRLYSDEDFETRPAFTDPEILRTNLASVLLQMAALGLGDLARFPFVDPPDRRQVSAGRQLLEELGALSDKGRLTRTGRRLATLPVDPRMGRMILEADRRGVLREVLVITAALSLPDPRERPLEHRARADQLHARFKHESSDFLALWNLWSYLRQQQRDLSSSAFRRLCKAEFLNYLRVREWQELESQLRQAAKQVGIRSRGRVSTGSLRQGSGRGTAGPGGALDEDGIHQALLAGLLSHVGVKDREAETKGTGQRSRGRGRPAPPAYLGARNTRFSIFPGSALSKRQPEVVMAAELVETSRLFARTNAAIDPAWAERLGAHLVKRSYSEPHWSRRRASVMAYERVTLYGVPLAADRLVSYGSVDRVLARELFIRHALVYGEWHTRHGFFAHNRRLLEEAEELENRARRRDLVVDEHTLFDFYDERVGEEVVSGAHFDTWWKQRRREDPDLLTLDPVMLLHDTAAEVSSEDFPDTWQEGPVPLPLTYEFDPGGADDGVTVDIPLTALNQVSDASLTWHVPGLRQELVVALLRSLPKQLRVSFVPAPDHARDFLAAVPPGREPLLDALERHLRARTGVHVPREAWDWSKVPAHLQPTYRIVDDEGQVVSRGKDLSALKEPLGPRFADALRSAASSRTRAGEKDWVFGTVERSFEESRAGQPVLGYPAVVDEGSTVGLHVLGAEDLQEAAHRRGVRRLLVLTLPTPAGRLTRDWDNARKLALAGSPYPSVGALLDDCVLAAAEQLMDAHGGPVWDEASFRALQEAVRPELAAASAAVLDDVVRVLEAWRRADRALSGRVDIRLLPAMTDLQAQIGRLVGPGFVAESGATRLRDLPRYLRAVEVRREKLDLSPDRDRQLMDRVTPLQDAYLHRVAALGDGEVPPAGLVEVRWMLEELRVSLWAQQLGTGRPVSEQRVGKSLAAL